MSDPTESKQYQDLQLQLAEANSTIRDLERELSIKSWRLAKLEKAARAVVDAEESALLLKYKIDLIDHLRKLLDK